MIDPALRFIYLPCIQERENLIYVLGPQRAAKLNTARICGLTGADTRARAYIMEALAQEIRDSTAGRGGPAEGCCRCLATPSATGRSGKNKEASKEWVIRVGAALHKVGATRCPLPCACSSTLCTLSKQLDNGAPNYMRAEFDANNTELEDAYTWLGATEAAIGKTVEAEASYKAGARGGRSRRRGVLRQVTAPGHLLPATGRCAKV